MASVNHLDTPITLKVNFDGVTRRYKLPLRDLNVNILEDKLRGLLQIPFGTAVTFERYSDSAASYVVLDPNNLPVYKQLYRAAKAKQKLKLRATKLAPVEDTNGPKPVTVEDEPEPAPAPEPECQAKEAAQPAPRLPALAPTPAKTRADTEVIDTIIAPQAPEDFPDFVHQWRARGMPRIYLRRNDEGVEVIDFLTSTSPNDPVVTLAPLSPSSASSLDSSLPPIGQYRFSKTAAKIPFATLYNESHKRELAAAKKNSKRPSAPTTSQINLQPHVILPAPEQKDEITRSWAACRRQFTVCCNSCDQAIPDAHFHCSTCDDGDFDLCQDCVSRGITCYDESHWLIKRTIKDGQISNSATHIAPKKAPAPAPALNLPIRSAAQPSEKPNPVSVWAPPPSARTCNCCVQEFPEQEFVHCLNCDDYDLCKRCFVKDQHGHHPKHGFTAAVPGTVFEGSISSRLSPGRNVVHNAICDGCDKYIRGVRHKCLDCPDWDYCATCQENAGFIHPNHRFVAIYEPLANVGVRSARAIHVGICCDGPLCPQDSSNYIAGVRYKCAICDDVDFCANCEASPANTHNKTHPLIKFKTSVRSVSVTTTGEHEDGQRLPVMGDRVVRHHNSKRSSEAASSPRDSIAATPVQTLVDVEPIEQEPAPLVKDEVDVKQEADVKQEVVLPEVMPQLAPATEKNPSPAADLVAIFKHDTVADGSVLPPNHTFEQTWVLRNEGSEAWPAGCSVKFVGGDYMGAIDPTHPAGVHELVSASESTVCYNALSPGQEFPFTVLMRTPEREGKVISYWRLTTRDGVKFGHKLWCDVTVKAPFPKVKAVPQLEMVEAVAPEMPAEVIKSQMIIPKLEHESPSSSIHEEVQAEAEDKTETTLAPSVVDQSEDDFEDCAEVDEWAEESVDGFMTDEEYDILDASDEEYLSEQQKK
ncbi:hypothetical protein SLS62_007177 [Diatrype stigma]|uniref:ZZ-type domain-containing protein n=1 Tax=Diatrype stigma TaxID=117547 RepID=A0AAN9UX94_9PEZI